MDITAVKAKNFSVFSGITIPIAQNMNVFIGENGTGKTHLLKSIYAGCKMSKSNTIASFIQIFKLEDTRCSLVRNPMLGNTMFSVLAKGQVKRQEYSFVDTVNADTNITYQYDIAYPQHMIDAAYIPVKDMLTHAKGLLAMSKRYKDFPFDDTLLDIIEKSNQWILKNPPKLALTILPVLEDMMQGTICIENEEFYVQKRDGRKVSFELEAEGLKKVGLLWQLLMNESITEGSVLCWDEPEANLNPKFIPSLVEALLILSRNGVQICLSTHSYILAKYIEIKAKETDEILFHSLYKQGEDVLCESQREFSTLQHNSIMDSFSTLMDDVYDVQVGK